MKNLKLSIIVIFIGGFIAPPVFWLLGLAYFGIVSLTELMQILLNPLLWLYVVGYNIFIYFYVNKQLNRISKFLNSTSPTDLREVQACITRLPKFFIFAEIIYCIIGPITGMFGMSFLNVTKYILGEFIAIPIILLFSLPFYNYAMNSLEAWTEPIPLPDKYGLLSLDFKLAINTLVTVLGILALLIIVNITIISLSPDDLELIRSTIIEKNLVMGIIGMCIVALDFVIVRNIVKPIVQITRQVKDIDSKALPPLSAGIQQLAQGDLTAQLSFISLQSKQGTSRDELGDLSRAFGSMQGSLEAIGKNLDQMTIQLRKSVGQVAENAKSVGTAAEQLSLAANQAGEATNQISVTIQQVASGTSQQSEHVSKTAGSIDQLTRAIDGVAKGAQDQSNAINETSLAMQKLSATVKEISSGAQQQLKYVEENRAALEQFSQSVEKLNQGAQSQTDGLGQAAAAGENLTNAIEQMAKAAGEVSTQVQEAAGAAQRGTAIVTQTTEGMQKVLSATDTLAVSVQGLGQRSGEIGAIISTIDDIASQTNLLALNAAIEAARAGEHGKGFAVVADEVRKLAEKSAVATKEIGALIRTVQEGAGDAVKAMQQAGEDVSAASEYTRQASSSFEAIVNGTVASAGGFSAIQQAITAMEKAYTDVVHAIEDARRIAAENKGQSVKMEELNNTIISRLEGERKVAESNTTAAEEMSKLNEVVIVQLDSTSAIVEENTAATEEMSASANEVTVMVENIASISEENSAATEEVSASTEEMSAQVEEVTASAASLAEMARTLQQVVAQFKL